MDVEPMRRVETLRNSRQIDPAAITDYLDYLCSAIGCLRDGRIPVVYLSSTAKWIGHLCQDSHILKSLFDESNMLPKRTIRSKDTIPGD